jgi:protein-tyrosine phosphatase
MIKLAPEEPKASDAEVPIRDMGIPSDPDHMACTILQALRRAIDGQQVFVGCLGGLGRTGTFLALLARACGEPTPVEYVRQSFRPAAVETPEQEIYVRDFPMELMKWGLRKLRLKLWLRDRGLTILADLV